MNNPLVTTAFALPSPNAAPLDFVQQVQILNTLVASQIEGDYLPYTIGHSVPSVDDRNKAWIELDSVGRPLAIKIWVTTGGGAWRRIYNGMLGQICMYNGDPSVDFDNDGRGLVGKIYDGWHLCNGNSGTIDLSDKFVIGGHMNKADGKVMYDNGWVTSVDPDKSQGSGGALDFGPGNPNSYWPSIDVGLFSNEIDGGALHRDANGKIFGIANSDFVNYRLQTEQIPPHIQLLPPFIALGFVQFIGYTT